MRIAHLHHQAGFFALLALDRNRELAELLGLDLQLPDNVDLLTQVNQLLLNLSKEVTGIVVEPIYSLDLLAQKAPQAGALLSLAQDKIVLPESLPALFPNFSLEEAANNYAVAKLKLNYWSGEPKAIEKKQLLAEIREYSHVLQMDFVLELISQPPSDQANAAETPDAETLLTTIQELRGFSDLLIVQNPADPLEMATIVSELDQPCLVTDNGQESYEQFKEKFRMAMDNGAAGYCLGPLLWREIGSYRQADQGFDLTVIQQYIQTTVRDRLLELNRIATEHFTTVD